MKIFLLGNGFDIYHHFPTRYIDFLDTTQYLVSNYSLKIKTVSDVFSSDELQKKNSFIAACYNVHREAYASTVLDEDETKKLVEGAGKNPWFKYFCKTYNKEIGWIDFEREIAAVIDVFRRYIPKQSDRFFPPKGFPPKDKHIIQHFSFFYEYVKQYDGYNSKYQIRSPFLIEEPVASKHYVANAEKIIDTLFAYLKELGEMLKCYLKSFVEQPLKVVALQSFPPENVKRFMADYVITFNYTNTYEQLYTPLATIYHIHGSTSENIILGTNPDSDDCLETMDASYIQFKKYYQRACLRTDDFVMPGLQGIPKPSELDPCYLYVVGHSLDISDEDIIKESFAFASEIRVLYHNENAHNDYIKKIIQLYGKDGFYQLRQEKNLQFLPLQPLNWHESEQHNSLSDEHVPSKPS